jgi:hypothetical protein
MECRIFVYSVTEDPGLEERRERDLTSISSRHPMPRHHPLSGKFVAT